MMQQTGEEMSKDGSWWRELTPDAGTALIDNSPRIARLNVRQRSAFMLAAERQMRPGQIYITENDVLFALDEIEDQVRAERAHAKA
jgi:hypothetical protein